ALIAGCDIHINYHNPDTTLPNPVGDTNPLRPKEPEDTRPPYPGHGWTTHGHSHEFWASLSASWGTIGSLSCKNGSAGGTCDGTGHVEPDGSQRSWWRDVNDADITQRQSTLIDTAERAARAVRSAFDSGPGAYQSRKSDYDNALSDAEEHCDDPANGGNNNDRIDPGREQTCYNNRTSTLMAPPDPDDYSITDYLDAISKYNTAMADYESSFGGSHTSITASCSSVTSCSLTPAPPPSRGPASVSNGCGDTCQADHQAAVAACAGDSTCLASIPSPVLICDVPADSPYDSLTPPGFFGDVSVNNSHDTTGGCGISGVSWSAPASEYHREYRVWSGWNPPKPKPARFPPVDAPRSYPHGITRDSTTAYTAGPKDPVTGERLDPAAGTPPVDGTDDAYCVSWGDWVIKPARKTWQPIDFSIPDAPDSTNEHPAFPYGYSITNSTNLAAPYHDTTWTTLSKHMSPEVAEATVDLEGGWETPSADPTDPDPPPVENHPRSSTADHGPDSLTVLKSGIHGTGPPRGGTSREFHPDYTPGTNTPKPGLVTKKPGPSQTIGYATDHWPAYVMEDPAPLHELCDFMGFKLANVAILAPAGGLIADQWFLPRQTGNNPTIEIQGSITVKHRGLFARSDTNGNLTTGYRKHFTHPTNIQQGTTTWWPDIKQNHWTPQP
ncbi:MAG: hypothetical protein OXI96_03305, partial [Acidimicrobiaceae bacterium]|nr:hypothetical protein [Acidimicrobiaceae bacterium]